MKIFCTALMAIILFSCSTEIAEPSTIQLPDDPEQLKALLTTQQDQKIKLDIYYALYKAYRLSDSDLAKYYLSKQKDLAEQIGDKLTVGKACYNMGALYDDMGDYLSAVDSYLKAINYFEDVNDISKIGSVLNNIGVVFMETGNYEYAKKFYLKTRDIHLKTNDTRRLVLAYLNLGICDFELIEPNYDSAKINLEEALVLAEGLEEKRKYYLNRIYTQMGTMYYKNEQYGQAIDNYLLSLQHVESDDMALEQKAIAYANIGEVLMEQGQYGEAKKWLNRALGLSENINDPYRKIGIFNITGRLYQAEANHLEAVNYFEEAINVADKEVINKPLQESLHLIRQSYVELRKMNKPVTIARYENVLLVDDRQDKMKEDLVEKTNFKALQAALGMKIELENTQKQKQTEAQLKVLFIAIAFFLGIVAILIAFRLRSTNFQRIQLRNKLNLAKYLVSDEALKG